MAPGSHLVICDFLSDNLTDDDWAAHHRLTEQVGIPLTFRPTEQLAGLFHGLDLVEPGLVPAPEWRPDRPHDPPSGWLLAGIGRAP